jgi:hypothetical protein
LNEPACLIDPVQQMGKRLRMPLAHEEVARIRSDCERLLYQPEKSRVHVALSVRNQASVPVSASLQTPGSLSRPPCRDRCDINRIFATAPTVSGAMVQRPDSGRHDATVSTPRERRRHHGVPVQFTSEFTCIAHPHPDRYPAQRLFRRFTCQSDVSNT